MDKTLVIIEVPGFDTKRVPGVIRAENMQGKVYNVGNTVRVEVIAVKQTKTRKIAVDLKPILKSR